MGYEEKDSNFIVIFYIRVKENKVLVDYLVFVDLNK